MTPSIASPQYVSGNRFKVRYTYDFLGRLKTMDTPAGTVAYDYHPAAAARVRTLPNGIQTTWRYYPNGSLRSITHAQNKRVLAQFTYRYGADGLMQEVHETDTHGSATLAYAYDAQQQLLRVTHSAAGVTEFSYAGYNGFCGCCSTPFIEPETSKFSSQLSA